MDSAFSSESLRVFQLFRGTFCERLGEFDGRKSATCPVEAAVVAEGLVVVTGQWIGGASGRCTHQ